MSGSRFGARTNARGQALQLLFQAEATGRLVADVLAGNEYMLDDRSWPLDTYGAELALGADGMLHELDACINGVAHNWSVGRMVSVDRNLLRLAVYEMACVDDVDVAVSINEFVELAKAYGTDESARFINGVLGRLARRMEAGEDLLGTKTSDAADDDAEAGVADAAGNATEAEQETTAQSIPVDETDNASVIGTTAATGVATTTTSHAVVAAAPGAVVRDAGEAAADEGGAAITGSSATDAAADAADDLPEWARG